MQSSIFIPMELFYVDAISDDEISLPAEESRHIIRALRKRAGDSIHITDGRGQIREALLNYTDKKQVRIMPGRLIKEDAPLVPSIHIAIAPVKNLSRFEWFLEKSTELGISRITPIICSHSEKRKIQYDRCQRILIAAMKQSLRAILPILDQPIAYPQFIEQWPANRSRQCMIAMQSPAHEFIPKAKNEVLERIMLIGPEGDFTQEEYQSALNIGYEGVNLSSFRLRTETAGLSALIQMHTR